MRQQRPTTPYVSLFQMLSPHTRASCVPTMAYNPICFTLPNALTCLSAGQLGTYLSNSLRTIQGIEYSKHTSNQLRQIPPESTSYLHHSGGQTSSLQLPSPLPSADACQQVIHCIKVPAILECVFSGKLISKLISPTPEADLDSTNCDKGVFKINRLPPLSLKQG